MSALMLVGLLLRLHWWSGYGLADDPGFKGAINSIVEGGVLTSPYAYRATWRRHRSAAADLPSDRLLLVDDVRERLLPVVLRGARRPPLPARDRGRRSH